jgi:hypothetical protein
LLVEAALNESARQGLLPSGTAVVHGNLVEVMK